MTVWMDWREIKELSAKAERVFFYGRSEDWVHKALRKINDQVAGIIDRDPAYDGSFYLDLEVKPFEKWKVTFNDFIIITAGDYDGIVDFLNSNSFTAGIQFVCSPDFKDYRYVIDFHRSNWELLISCSDYNDQTRARSSRLGGGIYTLNTSNNVFLKKINGSFRQVKHYKEGFVTVDYVDKFLLYFDRSFREIKRIYLDAPNYCGVAVDSENDRIFVVNAGTDRLTTVENFSSEASIRVSDQIMSRPGRMRESHINDLFFSDGKLFYSYFSASGNYKFGVFDGGVSHLDVETGEVCKQIIGNCWKPHSPVVHDNNLWVLDSMRGNLVTGVWGRKFSVGGFVRGLDFADNVAVIGRSQDMYISDKLGQKEVIPVDSGVCLLDLDSNACRFVPLNTIMNIHYVKVLSDV